MVKERPGPRRMSPGFAREKEKGRKTRLILNSVRRRRDKRGSMKKKGGTTACRQVRGKRVTTVFRGAQGKKGDGQRPVRWGGNRNKTI